MSEAVDLLDAGLVRESVVPQSVCGVITVDGVSVLLHAVAFDPIALAAQDALQRIVSAGVEWKWGRVEIPAD